jgi:hypothetical protein
MLGLLSSSQAPAGYSSAGWAAGGIIGDVIIVAVVIAIVWFAVRATRYRNRR